MAERDKIRSTFIVNLCRGWKITKKTIEKPLKDWESLWHDCTCPGSPGEHCQWKLHVQLHKSVYDVVYGTRGWSVHRGHLCARYLDENSPAAQPKNREASEQEGSGMLHQSKASARKLTGALWYVCMGRLKKLVIWKYMSKEDGGKGQVNSGRLSLFKMGPLISSFSFYSTEAVGVLLVPPTSVVGLCSSVGWLTCQSFMHQLRTELYYFSRYFSIHSIWHLMISGHNMYYYHNFLSYGTLKMVHVSVEAGKRSKHTHLELSSPRFTHMLPCPSNFT